jgi:hypothetical protein
MEMQEILTSQYNLKKEQSWKTYIFRFQNLLQNYSN